MKRAGILQVYTAVIAATPYSVATSEKVTEYADNIISHIDKTYPEGEGDGQEGYINRALDFANKYLDNVISQQEEWKKHQSENELQFGVNTIIGLNDEDLDKNFNLIEEMAAANKDREKAQAESRAHANKDKQAPGKGKK